VPKERVANHNLQLRTYQFLRDTNRNDAYQMSRGAKGGGGASVGRDGNRFEFALDAKEVVFCF
jgi:hypothetical protein